MKFDEKTNEIKTCFTNLSTIVKFIMNKIKINFVKHLISTQNYIINSF